MKLIHCADLHLDSSLRSNLSSDKAKERKLELLDNFRRLVDYAEQEGVTAILIAGDLFDTGKVSSTAKNVVLSQIENHPDIVFYYLKGNHDGDNFINTLEIIPDNLVTFSDTWKSFALGEGDRVLLHGAELDGVNSEAVQRSFQADPSRINIVMLHGQESESRAGDKAEIINIRNFRNKNIAYLALGHIHEYRRCELDGGTYYCYPGCLEGRGFDETGEHGFVLLDVNETTGIVTDTFVPFARRRVYDISVDITGLERSIDMLNRINETLEKEAVPATSMVKISLTGSIDAECELDTLFISHALEPDFFFVKISDETTITVKLEDYLKDESLKGEFVRTVMAADLPDEDKGAIVQIGLQAIIGGKLL